MATEQDVQLAFAETWKARRELARAEHEQHLAELQFDARKADTDQARDAVVRADERLQRLAEHSAGVSDAPPADADVPAPRVNREFRPIRR
jgi:hypothetical protein